MDKDLEQLKQQLANENLLQSQEYQKRLDQATQAIHADETAEKMFYEKTNKIIEEEKAKGSSASSIESRLMEEINEVNRVAEEAATRSDFTFDYSNMFAEAGVRRENTFLVTSDNGHVEFTEQEWEDLLAQANITQTDLDKYAEGKMSASEMEAFTEKKEALQYMLNVKMTEEEQAAFQDALGDSQAHGLDEANMDTIKGNFSNLENFYDAKTAEGAREQMTGTLNGACKEIDNGNVVYWNDVANKTTDIYKNALTKDAQAGKEAKEAIEKVQNAKRKMEDQKLNIVKSGAAMIQSGGSIILSAAENPEKAAQAMLDLPVQALKIFADVNKYKKASAEKVKAELNANVPSNPELQITKINELDKLEQNLTNELKNAQSVVSKTGEDMHIPLEGGHNIDIKKELVDINGTSDLQKVNLYYDGAAMSPAQASNQYVGLIKEAENVGATGKYTQSLDQVLKGSKGAKEAAKTAKQAEKAAKTAAKTSAKAIPVAGWAYAAIDAVVQAAKKGMDVIAKPGRGGDTFKDIR